MQRKRTDRKVFRLAWCGKAVLVLLVCLAVHGAYAAEPKEVYADEFKNLVIDLNTRTVGVLSAKTTSQDAWVKDIPPSVVGIGEGFCQYATILFPNTPKQLSIFWDGTEDFDCGSEKFPEANISASPHTIKYIEFSYTGDTHSFESRLHWQPGSAWELSNGVKVGTTVAELEKIFHSDIAFDGFETDGDVAGFCCSNVANFPPGLRIQLVYYKDNAPDPMEGYDEKVSYGGNSKDLTEAHKQALKVSNVYYSFK